MIPLLFAISPWLTQTQELVAEGNVKYYDPGLMPRVAVNRGYIDNPSEYDDWLVAEGIDGGASLLRRGDLGRRFSIIWPDGTVTTHIAIDCAQRDHYAIRLKIGDVAEVDYGVALEMGMVEPVPVTVVFDLVFPPTEFVMN